MDIRSYMAKHELSQEAFAKLVGVSQGLVWQWLNGRTAVTPAKAKRIEERTSGEVSRMECMYPDEPSRRSGDKRAAARCP
jgi:DNA-binding transcriptional regulator YdaS (Cro superfamily)